MTPPVRDVRFEKVSLASQLLLVGLLIRQQCGQIAEVVGFSLDARTRDEQSSAVRDDAGFEPHGIAPARKEPRRSRCVTHQNRYRMIDGRFAPTLFREPLRRRFVYDITRNSNNTALTCTL